MVGARRFGVAVSATALLPCLMNALTACTSNAAVEVMTTSTAMRSTAPANTSPVSTAAVAERVTAACPYISAERAAGIVGYRLGRITELVQAGHIVGCRLYTLQHPNSECDQSCLDHERLPPADVPGIEILSTRYTTPLDAHNAFVRTARAGRDYQTVRIEAGNEGVCYRTTVWANDRGTDWACAFSKGSTAIVIRTVVTDPAYTVAELARAVAPRL